MASPFKRARLDDQGDDPTDPNAAISAPSSMVPLPQMPITIPDGLHPCLEELFPKTAIHIKKVPFGIPFADLVSSASKTSTSTGAAAAAAATTTTGAAASATEADTPLEHDPIRSFTTRVLTPSEYGNVIGQSGMGEGFHVETVIEITNSMQEYMLLLKQIEIIASILRLTAQAKHDLLESTLLSKLTGSNHEERDKVLETANSKRLFHCTQPESVIPILENGFDLTKAKDKCFFGKALYFTNDPMKANDYSHARGNNQAIRVMLVCEVLMGRCEEFEMGRFDRERVKASEGFHSVQGFIRRAHEFVVYNKNQVYVSHVVLYRFTKPDLELAVAMNTPPTVNTQVVFITAALSEFFGKLETRAGPPGSENYVQIRRVITQFLRQQITPEILLSECTRILKASPPANMLERIKSEIAKCKLSPPTPQPIGTSAAVMPAHPAAAVATLPTTMSLHSPAAAAAFPVPPTVATQTSPTVAIPPLGGITFPLFSQTAGNAPAASSGTTNPIPPKQQ